MSDPTPDPELIELASAYLDGVADAADTARVEADPALLDEVERLRIARALVSTSTEEAPLSVREGHLAAALDVFDRLSAAERIGEAGPVAGIDDAAAAAITTPTPIGARRPGGAPRPIGQWLLGAAAALLLVVGGLAVFRAGQGDDDTDTAAVQDESTAADAPAAAADPFDEEALPRDIDSDDAADGDDRDLLDAEVAEADVAAAEASDDEVMADEVMADDAVADEALAEDEPTEEPAEAAVDETESGDDGGSESDAGVQPSPSEDVELPTLSDELDLGDYAAQAAYAPVTGTGVPSATPDDVADAPDEESGAEADTAGVPSVLRCRDAFSFDVVAGPALLDATATAGGATDPGDRDGSGDVDGDEGTASANEVIEVLVGVVDRTVTDGVTTGRVIAVDITCEIVGETDLPSEDDFQARSVLDPAG